ncbi:PBP1A family penicillin-binding protein [Undibacterium piscinae]|uniref:Penicillin-binding protein 1A n=1 Tax=Undibacterium piscinae TaxID=2495591 RepID=A0A6M4A3S2_9BURK|nr:PBP1A family penicillin-binding protein [Undibacterium piscinae]
MKWLLSLGALMAVVCAALLAFAMLVLAPDLPSLDAVTDYKPKIPLRIYTADNALIGEFGEEHRDFVPIKEIPEVLKNALLSIEDSRFYEHGGIDFIGVMRALLSDVTGGVKQGASTITMQVARNFFLTRERTVARKLKEIMLAYRIETALSKDQILELYMNQIYLGQRTHGFSSAARTYFGKPLQELSIAEAAMLAGIPQNPARHNPAVNPQRAKQRQILVLKSMRRLGHISDAQYEQASKEQLRVSSSLQFDVHAAYVAEMVRQSIFEQYKEQTYTMGIKVYTTINKAEQEAAYESLRRNVMAYDQRHGYRGPEAFIELPADEEARDDAIDDFLLKHPASDMLFAAVVTEASPKLVKAELASGESIQISGDGLRFASAGLQAKANRDLKLRPGALIRVMQDNKAKARWQISQMPEVDAAYVSLNAQDGSFRSLVGGFDFNRKKFNHVTSAWRQPGSSMKPFIYSAALEKGFFAGSMINDVPLSADINESLRWDPRNDDGKYDGPISMQTALAQSKNVVSVRILKSIGATYGRDYLPRFGFEASKHPVNLTLALGTGAVTPVQLAGAYAVFANGGYQVSPWLIQKVTDARGKLMFEAKVPAVAQEESRVIDARNAYIMDSMLREVTRSGTGAAATQRLGRHDLAGKTGTTSDAVDGWFAGYASNIVAVAWMGYDDPKSLGGREFGATLALPIWIDSMRTALAGKPEVVRATPENVVNVDGKWSYTKTRPLTIIFMSLVRIRPIRRSMPAA